MKILVQTQAPGFTAPTVMPDNSIREDFTLAPGQGRYHLVFFYPWDFSTVCPTELLALDLRLEDFQKRGCDVLAISTDSQFSHLAWKKTPVEEGGIGPVRFPLVADPTKEISKAYGVLSREGVALRGTFLIDGRGTIRQASINDTDLGRNIPEILRTLDAIKHIDDTGETCPANWDGSKRTGGQVAGVKKNLQTFDLD